jgi:Domain of unknown function (DUF397)
MDRQHTEMQDDWRKASYSNGSGACVEVGSTARAVLVRDTNDRDGGTLAVTAKTWAEFTARLK